MQLIARCGSLGPPARAGCYRWFGTALSVLTDGHFVKTGCPRLASRAGRVECTAGARRMNEALITFA
jgi:hypothetical protein